MDALNTIMIYLYGTILHVRSLFFLACILISASLSAQDGQGNKKVLEIISQSQQYLNNHQYGEAITSAQVALDQSTRLNYKEGMVNSLLLLAQAQKHRLNYTSSLNYFLQALPEVKKQNNNALLVRTNTLIGELFQEWGVPEKALLYYQSALQIHDGKDNRQTLVLIERTAEVHNSLHQKDMSLKMYFQLLDLTKKNNDPALSISALQKIVSIYYGAGDIDNSLKYNLQILELYQQQNDKVGTASTLNSVGNYYKDLKNPGKAIEYYQAALEINRQLSASNERDNRLVTNLINIGTIYQERGDTRNSIKTFKEALAVKIENGTPVEQAVMYNYLASLYLSQSDFAEAEQYTREAISLLTGTENRRMLATNHKRLSSIYAQQGNYEKALMSYKSYSLLNDSLLYQEQLVLEKEKLKQYLIETTEKEAKLSLIDQEVQSLKLRNEKETAERERQEMMLLLKEKELQNVSLQKDQSEQARAVQQLQLQQGKIEKEKQEQEIVLLEQKRVLQNAEIERKESQEKERLKELAYKNTRLELQQYQLERADIRQQNLIYVSVLFLMLILFGAIAYFVKRRDNKRLEVQFHEINKQKEEIEVINKSLIELNEEKNDLIGIVAHDLKSPLNQISGMLEIMKLTAKQSEEQQGYVSRIEQSTTRLKNMVTKILDVSAIESKTLNITPESIDLTRLLDEMVNRFLLMAEKKQIRVIKNFEENLPKINSDRSYVSEVLENLMSNAVKYSPLGKEITVRLGRCNQFLKVEFMDRGQGISEKDMKNLFGKYHKLSARPTAGEDSTGLGLSIVKKYVLALGGKVWCESEVGKGSNFIVELPLTLN